MSKEATTAVVPLGVSDPTGAEVQDSCAVVMFPTLVTAVFPERWSPSVAVDTSEVTWVSPEVLFKPECGLVTGPKLVFNVLVVPSVAGDVAGTGGERSLACDVGEIREGDIVSCKATSGEGDVLSWSEERLVCDTSSELVSTLMVTSERVKPRVPAE